jgi:hypothetical protein
MKFDETAQIPPRDDCLHLAQAGLASRLVVMDLKTYTGQGHLTYARSKKILNQIITDLPTSGDLIKGSTIPTKPCNYV